MKHALIRNGHLGWTPVVAFCCAGLALVLGDYLWRVSSVSGKVIAAGCALVVLGAVMAVVLDWVRQRPG